MADPFGNFTGANHSADLGLGSARLVAEPRSGDNAAPVGVGELAARLKRVVEQEFGHVRLRGEISGYKRVASGHAYLCLKDEGAVIDGVIWKAQVAALAFVPQDGIEVIATGRITTYPGRSKYQIVIDRLELAGEGALMALLDKIKAKLAGEGLFDVGRKQRLPFLPRVIGVVTSPTGAVIRDILHRLADRCPTHVLVWPVVVQGEGAAAQIARAIAGFDALNPDLGAGSVPRPDLIIVARGGGSIEDLWAFNEEVVVRAIAACRIPIISAVGHETDTTLGDFAADLRAPTPSAAAELAVPVVADLRVRLDGLGERMARCAARYHARGYERLGAIVRVLPRRDLLLAPQRRRADDLAARLDRGLVQRVTRARGALHRSSGGLRLALLDRALDRARDRLRATEAVAAALDPDNVLRRGYVRVTTRGDRTLTTAAEARAAGAVTLRFRDGAVAALVDAGAVMERVPGSESVRGVEQAGAPRYDRGKPPARAAKGGSGPEQPILL